MVVILLILLMFYGSSEVVLGNWLAKQKDPKAFRRNVIIATKFKMSKPPHGLNDKGGNRKHIIDSVNDSLANLQTDYIDLYQIHSWDTACELRETLSALNDLIRQGKVHYIGASNFTAWQLQKAVDLQDKYGWDRFYTLQQQYSLLMRNIEWDSVEVCKNEGIGILPWSPLAGGWLSGKYKRGDHKPLEGGRVAWAESVGWGETGWDTKKSDQTYNIIEELEKIGKEVNQPVAAVALRWLIQKPGVSSTIIGATTIKQLEQNLAAAKFSLSDEQVERLNKVSETPLPYPFNVIKSTNS